jgi:hypothetical protein
VVRGLAKGDTVFSPIVVVVEDHELLAIQWMKGMGDCEYSGGGVVDD